MYNNMAVMCLKTHVILYITFTWEVPVYYIHMGGSIAVEIMCVHADFSQTYDYKGQHFKKNC